MPKYEGIKTAPTGNAQVEGVKKKPARWFEELLRLEKKYPGLTDLERDSPELANLQRMVKEDEALSKQIKARKRLTRLQETQARRKEILGYLKEGLTQQAIAEKMYISSSTVWHHVNAARKNGDLS